MKFKVGDGSSTKFWHDPWSEGLPWENNFTELYNISSYMEASVAELLSFEGETTIEILVLYQFKIGS